MTEPILKQSILRYIDELKTRGIIRKTADLIPLLVDELNSRGVRPKRLKGSIRPRDHFVAEDLKNLSVRPGSPVVLSLALCESIADCLQTLEIRGISNNERLGLYQRHFPERKASPIDNYTGQHLFHTAGAPPLHTSPALIGDYVLFRPEARPIDSSTVDYQTRVSLSFIRFYCPKLTGGLRFMLLPFTFKNEFLAAKGWVDDMGKSYLLVGQVIDRNVYALSDERVYGGCSVIAARSRPEDRFVCYSKDKNGNFIIQASPTVSFRALANKAPSLSRGYLVRATGAEAYGGNSRQSEAERFLAMKDLQRRLFEKYRMEEDIESTAKKLQSVTGFDSHYFYSFKEQSGSSGLLVNLPFRGLDRPDKPTDRKHLTSQDIWPLALPSETAPFWAMKEETRGKPVDLKFGLKIL